MKKILLLLGVLTVVILNCSKEGSNVGEKKEKNGVKKYRIGITQIISHPALDVAKQGFKDELKEEGIDVEYDEENANGEITTANMIASNFVNSKKDLIYSIATTSTQSVSQSTGTIPIVFSAITDPKSSGIMKENVTGISDRVDIKKQLELLLKIDNKIKKIGTMYNSSEPNSKIQIENLKKVASELGLTVIEKSVSQMSEIPQVADITIRESDALYLLTDNLVASVINLITGKAVASKKIVFGSELAHVKGGALITQGIDYYSMGREAGKIAIDILKNNKNVNNEKY